MVNFVFLRGLLISFIQLFFIIIFYFNSIPCYNGNLILLYTTVYTSFPVFNFIMDQDVDKTKVINIYIYIYIIILSYSLIFTEIIMYVYHNIRLYLILFCIRAFKDQGNSAWNNSCLCWWAQCIKQQWSCFSRSMYLKTCL